MPHTAPPKASGPSVSPTRGSAEPGPADAQAAAITHPYDAPYPLARWPRREAFQAFSRFANPYVGCCVMLDAAALRAHTRACGDSFALACHFLALRVAQAQEPMRLRLRGRQLRLLHRVHGSTTVLRPDGSFGFAVLLQCDDWPRFQAQGRQALAAVRAAPAGQALREPEQAVERCLMHFTTVPWLHFTHFSHPRRGRSDASIPKLAFGGWREDGAHLWLPVSLEVHHALMDGLHLGQYLQALQAAMNQPATWLVGDDTSRPAGDAPVARPAGDAPVARPAGDAPVARPAGEGAAGEAGTSAQP